jgi:hypothetical protein
MVESITLYFWVEAENKIILQWSRTWTQNAISFEVAILNTHTPSTELYKFQSCIFTVKKFYGQYWIRTNFLFAIMALQPASDLHSSRTCIASQDADYATKTVVAASRTPRSPRLDIFCDCLWLKHSFLDLYICFMFFFVI